MTRCASQWLPYSELQLSAPRWGPRGSPGEGPEDIHLARLDRVFREWIFCRPILFECSRVFHFTLFKSSKFQVNACNTSVFSKGFAHMLFLLEWSVYECIQTLFTNVYVCLNSSEDSSAFSFRGEGWMELPFLLHARWEFFQTMNLSPGCRSGADSEDGMENSEIIDLVAPICGGYEDGLSHI